MPVLIALIAPLMALYLKYKVMQFAVKLILFMAVFTSFKQGMQFVINTIFSQMNGISFGCMSSYILDSLDVFPMLNFGLSLWATIYIGRFFYNSIMKVI